MMRRALALGFVLVPTFALAACSSDDAKGPATGQAGASASAGAPASAGASSESAGASGAAMSSAGASGASGAAATEQAGSGPANACSNGVKDGTETDVDCGSACKQCADEQACVAFSDCHSAHCVDGTCRECAPDTTQCSGNKIATCTNGKWVDGATECPNGCDLNSGTCKQ